jgi:hypothetical protein
MDWGLLERHRNEPDRFGVESTFAAKRTPSPPLPPSPIVLSTDCVGEDCRSPRASRHGAVVFGGDSDVVSGSTSMSRERRC